MWPKILFELLPHFAKLAPVADKFLSARSGNGNGHDAAFAAMAESVHGDLGQVAETHAGIQRTLREQGMQVAEIAVEITRVRIGVESVEDRIAKLELKAAMAMRLLAAALLMLTGTLGLLVFVLTHMANR